MSTASTDHENAGSARPTPALSIVALDDDADFREFIAATPQECFTRIEEHMPDVLLLDMKMGRHSGEGVLLEVRRRWPKLCVIVVTGYPSLETMRQTFKQDVYDYLEKPFSLEELRATLGSAAREFNLGGRPQDRLRQELGRQIRLARTDRGWTLKELSEHSGVSVSQLSSIERGAHLPSLESLLAIAAALDVQPSAWLGESGF